MNDFFKVVFFHIFLQFKKIINYRIQQIFRLIRRVWYIRELSRYLFFFQIVSRIGWNKKKNYPFSSSFIKPHAWGCFVTVWRWADFRCLQMLTSVKSLEKLLLLDINQANFKENIFTTFFNKSLREHEKGHVNFRTVSTGIASFSRDFVHRLNNFLINS